ncbi:unnamed protein product [Mytilus coruscus]|uniref:Uncharacterized protein n=1 Tax=Mytilus coruscus TaxID=42192 RepID=A0A6J8EPT8_MYTCO|nr:unnamed protein product [Mytilus coruscus]
MESRWWQRESLIKFESPTSFFIFVPSNSGKSFFTKQLLMMAPEMFKIPPSKIYFSFSVWQDLYYKMVNEIPQIQFHKGLPSMELLNNWGEQDGHKIIVFDDLIMDAADSAEMSHIMCVGSHHYNMTVIQILQNVFQKGKSMRTASLNYHYFILFRSFRDVLQIQTLGKQMFPGQTKFFMEAYHKSTKQRFGYLLLDLHPHTDKTYQLRTHILPGQFYTIYQPIQ